MQSKLNNCETSDLNDIAANCLCFKARKAARTITRFYDRFFAETSLEPAQFNILVAARLTEPIPIAKLADHLALERTTFTRNLALLQRNGLVNVRRGDDARQRLLSVTSSGRRAIKAAVPKWRLAQKSAISSMGTARFTLLSSALDLAAVLAQPEVQGHQHHQRGLKNIKSYEN